MEEDIIIISNLNDFVFCPASIYFHNLYGSMEKIMYQGEKQLNGSSVHYNVDNNKYSSKKSIITSLDVYTEKYNIVGKIDIFDVEKGILTERKKHINKIYDGYIFQVYAQYFALSEMGYKVKHIRIHSIDDNRSYKIKLPEEDFEMYQKFEAIVYDMHNFNLESFEQTNSDKCRNCIYEPMCDRSVK